MQIFDAIVRANARGARFSESTFAFLNRAKSEFFGNVRVLLQDWFDGYPNVPEKAQVLGRLRSNDDRQFDAAFWELYLYRLFVGLGYAVSVEPDIAGSPNHPDFLVEGNNGRFYLEATVLSKSDNEVAADRRRAMVYDALNRLSTPNFFLWVEVVSEGAVSPASGRLRRELTRWLENLDPDKVAESYKNEGGFDALPLHRWTLEGWEVVFRAIPKKPESRGDDETRPLGAWGPGRAHAVTLGADLRDALDDKASRYGDLDAPLVLAILSTRERGSRDLHYFEEALYGSDAYRFDVADPERGEYIKNPNGLWHAPGGPANRRVSGVLGALSLFPWHVAGYVPSLWPNPWAFEPLDLPLPFPAMRLVLEKERGRFETVEGTFVPNEIFGLDPDWPGPEDLERG